MRVSSLRRFAVGDPLLGLAAFILCAFGFAAIYSVELSRGSDLDNLKKHALALALGFLAYLFASHANYRLFRSYATILYLVSIILLVGVLFFGTTVRGTTGWFSFGPLNFQPVEYAKVALAIALAAYFSGRARRVPGWREIGESGLIAAFPAGLAMLQPDLGSAILLAAMWAGVVVMAGLRRKHVLILALAGVLAGAFAWQFAFAPYQRARLTSFLHPESDPLGQGYNVTQAIIAVGSGGLLGRGLGFGSQSQLKFLPESQTDFIFAVIAEELGFLGVVLVLSSFGLLLWRIGALARRSSDDFAAFLLLAIGSGLLAQCFVNLGMNVGMMPVTGVTLPLVSYGGSSILLTCFMLGLVQSVARASPSAPSEAVIG